MHRILVSSQESTSTLFGWEENAFTNNQHVVTSEYLIVFSILLFASVALQHYVHTVWKLKCIPESGATLLMNMIVGLLLRAYTSTNHGRLDFTNLGFSSTMYVSFTFDVVVLVVVLLVSRSINYTLLAYQLQHQYIISCTCRANIDALCYYPLYSGG